jgi:hypothetical protein
MGFQMKMPLSISTGPVLFWPSFMAFISRSRNSTAGLPPLSMLDLSAAAASPGAICSKKLPTATTRSREVAAMTLMAVFAKSALSAAILDERAAVR